MIYSTHYEHLPPHLSTIHVALFQEVRNSSELRSRIVQAATLEGDAGDLARDAVNYAFIDARLITSVLHLQTAIYQAILSEVQGTLRTKTVHSEILWALNPSNNISEAIRRYGVSDVSTALAVVRVSSPGLDNVEQHMRDVVDGNLQPLDQLNSVTDWQAVKKHYKLNGEAAIKALLNDVPAEQALIDSIVVSSVAMKSVMQ